MSNDRPNRWRVKQALRWAKNELVAKNLWSKSWNEARKAYNLGDLDREDWELFDAFWHADGTKPSSKGYQVKRSECHLVRTWVDLGLAADVNPGATWEQINAPAGQGLA